MKNDNELSDAFGKILLDHYDFRKPVYYVIERDDGLIDVGTSSNYFSVYEDWPKEEQNLINQAISPVLDLGCGAGRHSLYLQNKGFQVIAMDLSQGAINVTRLRGVKQTIYGDIKDLPKFNLKFGSVLFMGNNFALCGDPETSKNVLINLTEITAPKAKIIAHFRDPSPDNPDLDPIHHEYHNHNRKRGLPIGQTKIRILYRKHRTPWFSFYIPTREEFIEIIENTSSWKINTLIQKEQFIFTVIKRI